MKILVTGSSGLVGSALLPALRAAGHQVTAVVRRAPRSGAAEVQWDPLGGGATTVFEGADAVVHLAGENIGAGRWSAARKSLILNSRVQGTQTLATTLARLSHPPRVLVSASAQGYYGNRGDELLQEDSAPGNDFLAEVCRQWESATQPASRAGVRVVLLRFGLILSSAGGALPRTLPLFRLGLGGKLGSGRQWWSWIAIDDVVSLIQFALAQNALRGPVNAVAPNPVTNAEFTRVVAHVLSRPALFPAPAFILRAALGEMADSLLLASQRVRPAASLAAGFTYTYPVLEPALRHILNK